MDTFQKGVVKETVHSINMSARFCLFLMYMIYIIYFFEISFILCIYHSYFLYLS